MTSAELKNVFPDWKIVHEIGHGSFGAVYEIEKDNFGHKEKSALKVISIPQNNSEIDDLLCDGLDEESITSRYENYMQDVVREYSMMADMNGCANIVYGDEVKYIRHDNRIGWDIFIRMELLTPLIKALGETIPDSQVIKIGMDICRALAFCKANKVIHRDIKPQNIFVARDGTYKLGDFGEAKTSDHSTSGAKTGTYKYMAPEVYNNQPYSNKADIYSLGLVLYWLLNERRTPFLPLPPEIPTLSDEENARNRRFSGAQIPEPRHGSDVLKKIVLKACAFNTKDRYQDAAEMLKDLTNLAVASELAADVLLNTLPHERTNKKEETAGTIDNDDETVGAWKRETKRPKSKTDYSQEESTDEDTFSAKRNRALSSTGGGNQGKRVGRKRKTAETVFLTISVICICICIGLIVLAKITGPIDPVQGFQINTVGTTSAVLSWEKNKDAAAYELSYKFHSASEWNILKSSTSETKININNLQAGKPYDFRIKAISGNSESEYTELDNIYTKYAPVSGMKTEDVTQDTVLLKWNASPNAFTYTVEYKEHSENDWIVAKENLKETSAAISGLSQGTSYDFRITAAGEALPSDYSELKNQYTCYSAVKDLVENCVNTDSVILTWSPVENAAEYRIEYREHETEEWLSASSAEETSATVDSLSSGVAYDFRVCAAGDAPNSEYTYLDSVYTHYEPIAEVEASNIRTSTVSLTWSPVVNAQKYYVEYKESNTGTWTKHFPDVAATSVTSLSVTGLKSGTSYDFRICAAGDGKSSEYTYCSGVWTKYPEVKAFTITPQDMTAVNLSWEKVSGASSYDVSYRKKGGNSWQTVSDRMSATSTVLNDLEVGSVYEFRIRAVGEGPASDYTSVTYRLTKKYQIGDTVYFGSYEQDHAYNNSGKAPIEWQILDIKDGNALLISKYALLSDYFSESIVVVDKNDVTWQGSSLRTNLNGKFYSEAFSSAEKKHIVSTRLSENKEDKYCNRSCLATTDNIFLLSMSEAEKYFKTNAARRCEPSKHVSDDPAVYNVMPGEYCEYWLRSATERIGFSLVVQADGAILEAKGYHQNTRMPVRPALWVEMEGLS